MKKIFFTICFATIIASPSLFASSDSWYEYKSHNFTIYSDVNKKEVENVIQDMERFRVAALRFTGIKDFKENEKLRLFYFDDSDSFYRFLDNRNVAGFFHRTWNGPVIMARSSGHNMDVSGLMFHEYTHHLMRQRSMLRYPRWYSEGFAELLSSAEILEDYVRIGNVPMRIRHSWSVKGFRPLKLEQLLVPEDRTHKYHLNNFYATAWLLTHYLQMGKYSGNPDYIEKTGIYLKAVSQGEDPIEAFPRYFGPSVDEMQKEMNRYRDDDVYAFRYKVPAYKKGIKRTKLSKLQVAELFVQQAFTRNNDDLVLELVSEAGKDAQESLFLKLSSAIASGHKDDYSLAKTVLSEVDTDAWHSAKVYQALSHSHLDLLDATVADGGWSDSDYQLAVNFGKLAVERDPENLLAYRSLWMAYQRAGEHLSAVQTMMAAYEYAPRSLSLNREIGFYIADLRQLDLAKPYLEVVSIWSHSDEDRERANNYLRQLESQSETVADLEE